MTVLGAISGATSEQPRVPPCSLGNGLHSISGWFEVGLGWLANAYSGHSIHKAKEVGHKAQRGHLWDARGWFPGCKVMILQANRIGSVIGEILGHNWLRS